MADIRLELSMPIEPRASDSLDKDSTLVNCFVEAQEGNATYTIKRGGFLVGTEGITTGLYRGIFTHGTNTYYINSSGGLSFYINPNYWDANTNYSSGSIVYYNGEEWYSQIDNNIGNVPVEGDDWSTSPPPDEILIMQGTFLLDPDFDGEIAYEDGVNHLISIILTAGTSDLDFFIFSDTPPIFVTLYSTSSFPDGGVCKLTRTPTEYKCYIDDIVVATYPYFAFTYTTTYSDGSVTDVTFGPPNP